MCCGKGWSMMEGTMENYKGSGLGRKRKGFMLLELIIVVAIVGILSAVAMPDILGMTNDAKAARIQADLSAIGTASEMYYVLREEWRVPDGAFAAGGYDRGEWVSEENAGAAG